MAVGVAVGVAEDHPSQVPILLAFILHPSPPLTQLSLQSAAAATLNLFVPCVSVPACAAEELPGLVAALCWVPPPLAGLQVPSCLAVVGKMHPNLASSGSDGGHQVL